MIHVCFGLYDKHGTYSKFTGTTILSLFENLNTPPQSTTVHILHDNTLTLDNREKFSYLAGQYNQLVKFYNVEELYADKLAEINESFSNGVAVFTIGAMYRFFIPQIIPADVDKVIYLDSDIIVNLDIKELWKIELGDKPLAAVTEMSNGINSEQAFSSCRAGYVNGEDYFNAGVLLINLKFFQSYNLLPRVLEAAKKHPQVLTTDQEILNYLFSKVYLKLPVKFNSFAIKEPEKADRTRRIYHFVGTTLTMDMGRRLNRLWMKYFMKTPWFNGEAIGRLYTGVRQMNIDLKISMIQISAAMSGKTRAFFTIPANVDALKKIFLIRDDEEIIPAENQSSLQKLINAMNASRGKKVFFILVPGFPFQALTEAGFVFGRDFFNGMEFLSEAHGVLMNSHQFIKAM